MRRAIALSSILCFAGTAFGDGISAETLKAVKRATVFLKTESKLGAVSGSGFVVKIDGDAALIATNFHVVAPKLLVEIESPPPSRLKRPGGLPRPAPRILPKLAPRFVAMALKDATVTAVFGSGTASEWSARTEIVAIDPENDLAILRTSSKGLSATISCDDVPELIETSTVYALGFPFGKLLATGGGGPAITISKAAISSLRMNDDGELALVQIDGALNPGNSGGPIVDDGGRLVGIAVATVRDSVGIGLAVPAEQLKRDLAGRVGALHLNPIGDKSVDVEAGLIDPLRKLKSARILCIPMADAGDWRKLKSLAPLAGVKNVALAMDKQLATARVDFDRAHRDELVVQIDYDNGAGKEQLSRIAAIAVKSSAELARPIERPAVEPPIPVRPPVVPPKGSEPDKVGEAIVVKPWGFYGGTIGLPVVAVRDRVSRENPSHADRIENAKIFLDGDTEICGNSSPLGKDLAPDGGLLVGMEVGYSREATATIPIYRTSKGEVHGQRLGERFDRTVVLKAKEGYAVGGLLGRCGAWVDRFCLLFMKVKPDGMLDVDDAYFSDYVGSYSAGAKLLGGTGAPVVGVQASVHDDRKLWGIGLTMRPYRAGETTPAPVATESRIPPRRARPRPADGSHFPSADVVAYEQRSNPTRLLDAFELAPIRGDGETELIGMIKENPIRDSAPNGGLLVGFEVGTARNDPLVQAMTPIFLTAEGEVRGKRHGTRVERKFLVAARKGYAVGGLVVRSGITPDGFYVIFMKVKADHTLDTHDTYSSEWIGGYSGGQPILVGATGAFVTGFLASVRPNDRLGALGLILEKQ